MAEGGLVQQVSDANFDAEVVNSAQPTLVDFWAPWCGPCRAIAPVVEELAGSYQGKVNVRKMNVDDNQQTASKFGIRAIPTLLMFKNGQVVDQVVGAVPRQKLEDMMAKHG
jgi:thioredoxin 1